MEHNDRHNILPPFTAAHNGIAIRELGLNDIPAMLSLQDRVGTGDILAKTAPMLAAHFNTGNTAFGIEQNGVLVAQTILTAEPMLPDTATIGFMMTDPAHRGQGLNDTLVTAALVHLGYNGFRIAQARVKTDNSSHAWTYFEKHGFATIGTGESPDQTGRQVYTLQKRLSQPHFLPANNVAAQRQRPLARPVAAMAAAPLAP